MKPSLSIVKRTCSEPGVIVNSDFVTKPFSTACCAIDADLEISSYDEFVQDPIKPTSTLVGQLFFSAFFAI